MYNSNNNYIYNLYNTTILDSNRNDDWWMHQLIIYNDM